MNIENCSNPNLEIVAVPIDLKAIIKGMIAAPFLDPWPRIATLKFGGYAEFLTPFEINSIKIDKVSGPIEPGKKVFLLYHYKETALDDAQVNQPPEA